MLRDRRNLAHQVRRGVGGENRFRPAQGVQPAKDVLLECQVLEHRFDHQTGVPYVVQPGAAQDPGSVGVGPPPPPPPADPAAGPPAFVGHFEERTLLLDAQGRYLDA